LGNSGEIPKIQDGGQLPPDPKGLEHTKGNPNCGISPQKNTSGTYETYARRKAYLAMHGNAWQISENSDSSQIFIWVPIHFRFGYMTRTDPKGHP